MRRALTAAAAAAAVAVLAAGCGSSGSGSGSSASGSASTAAQHVTLRLGFLENITHASALIGIKEGFFTKDLGPNVTLKLVPFSTGSGGAELVVKSGITSAAQLKGQKLATPSLGNTQDVSLRHWLKTQGLTTSSTGGGDVPITPITPNSDAVLAFKSGSIAGGWEPAPYDAEMLADGGHVLVNEATLWPQGQFVTTEIVATQSFIKANPTVISGLLKAQIEANSFIASNKTQAETDANAELAALSGKALKSSIVAASFAQITFTNDPIASSLITDANNAVGVGLLKPVSNLSAIYDLGPLNKLLAAGGQPAVSS
jgi:NitT/TauT family transport system substrate-binding protein